jgi:hypothetical protein
MHVSIAGKGDRFYSEGFAVRFFKDDGTDWVANFKPGWTDLKQVIEFQNTQNLIIVACGTCYLMNPNDTVPLEVFGGAFSDIFQASNNRLVLQEQIDLTIIESDGKFWHTERISWDGLADLKVENNMVTGLSFSPTCDADEWVPFVYDLNTKTLTGGSFHIYDIKKPWWKFW